MDREALIGGALWVWVALATSAYLYQFKDVLRAALEVLGLA